MAKVPGIYVEVKGDYGQLQKDISKAKDIVTGSAREMSDSLNNALAPGQLKQSINKLIGDLSTLSNASKVTGQTFGKLGVDLGELRKVTGMTDAQFKKLQQQLLQTQAAKAQETALRNIAKSAGLTQKEIATLGKQFGLSKNQIEGVTGATSKAGSAFSGLLGYISPAIAGYMAFNKVAALVTQEFKYGLKAVEDFGMSVAQSTALITTFSQRAKGGDLSGAYIEANTYAKELTLTLEMIDQKTIANSRDLQAMSETFIANGVLLDINNQKQVEGFTAVANALAIMTQGQNKDIQMRQEIRGLMDGEIRSQDKLGMLLKAQIPDIEKQLVKWREQGTTLENLGKLLEGFNKTTGLLEDQWATVGSTMETIHNRVLRGMFEPVFDDLIQLAKDFNKSMMDANGNLTPLARGIIEMFKDGYDVAKSFFDLNDKGWLNMIARATLYGQVAGLASDAFKIAKGILEDYGKTGIEKTQQDIAEIEQKLSKMREGEWIEGVQIFMESPEEMRELNAQLDIAAGKLSKLRESDPLTELQRTSGGPTGKTYPQLAPPNKAQGGTSLARDYNSAAAAELELLKATEEKKLAIIRASLDQEKQQNEYSYQLGLTSYSEYLSKKNKLTQDGLREDLAAKERELAAAKQTAASLKQITDKDGNARPDKDAKATADAYKKVEDAERAVIEARNKLTEAEVEGNHAAAMAAKETEDGYKQIEIQLAEMQGNTVEAARLMEEYDEETVERQRLIADAANGNAAAQRALNAERLMGATRIRQAELDQLRAQKESLLSLAQIDGEYYKSLDIQTDLLDIEIERAELAGELPEHIAILRRQRDELEMMKNPLTAFVKGWHDVVKEQQTVSEQMYDLATDTARDLQDAFSDTFFSVMKGNFEDIGEIWDNLLDRMLDAFLRMIADMVAAWAATELFQYFTGTGDGDWFSYFTAAGKGQGAGGGVGGAITGVVGEIGKEYVTQGVKDSIASYFSSSAATAASTSTSLANGTATPAILDAAAESSSGAGSLLGTAGGVIGVAGGAYGMYSGISNIGKGNYAVGTVQTGLGAYSTYQGATTLGLVESGTATTAYNAAADAVASYFSGATTAGTTTAGTGAATGATAGTTTATTGAAAGSSSGATTAGIAASTQLGVGAALMAGIALYGLNKMSNNVPTRNSFGHEDPANLSPVGLNGSITGLTKEQVEVAKQFDMEIKQFGAASLDAANGVMVATNSLKGPGGFIDGTKFAMYTWDEASKTWYKGTKDNRWIWEEMISQMRDLNPTTQKAIDSTAAYVAQMNGMPSIADELAVAFTSLNDQSRNLTPVFTDMNAGLKIMRDNTYAVGDARAYEISLIDKSTGMWRKQDDIFGDMLDTMQDMRPASQAAVDATAEIVAAMYGVDPAAEYLAQTFTGIAVNLGGLANYAVDAVGKMSKMDSTKLPDYKPPAYIPEGYVTEGYDPYSNQVEYGHATGGWIGKHGSGWIHQGSGVRDDVFLGYTDGGRTRNFGMGGEFVVNRVSAALFSDELERINRTFAPVVQPAPATQQPAQAAISPQSTTIHNHFYVDGKEIATQVKKITSDQAARGFSRLSA